VIRIAVAGCSGRMGRMLIQATLDAADLQLAVALDRADSPEIGRDCAGFLGRDSGVLVGADLAALAAADVLIDFTRPEATAAHLRASVAAGTGIVIGTTGIDAAGRAAIEAAAQRIPIVFAPNMSIGVNAALQLIAAAARMLGADYDVEIVEAHHRHKVDAPSGTALLMGETVAAARGRTLAEVAVYGYADHRGERRPESIGFASLRGGDIVGDHTVLFAGEGERIEITHRSASRATYAAGSLRAARFLAGRAPGLYGMRDVLGLP
jgi:4-hydroxy-tetrahydrodipicolinate reductase